MRYSELFGAYFCHYFSIKMLIIRFKRTHESGIIYKMHWHELIRSSVNHLNTGYIDHWFLSFLSLNISDFSLNTPAQNQYPLIEKSSEI